ncbi:hypothetical protein GGF50DRAFT_48461 [Schizophyllum commune]
MSATTRKPVTVVAEDAPAQATNIPIGSGAGTYDQSGQAAGRFKRRRMSTNSDSKPAFENKLRGSLAAMTAKTARNESGANSGCPIIAQPAPAKMAPVQAQPQPAMEMTLLVDKRTASKNALTDTRPHGYVVAARARIASSAALAASCAVGMCDCVADIICCPCEMCC